MVRGLPWIGALLLLPLGCERRAPVAKKLPQAPAETPAPKLDEEPEAKQQAPRPLAPLIDKGIFDDLDDGVTLRCPKWLDRSAMIHLTNQENQHAWWSFDGVIVCAAAPQEETIALIPSQDHDGDHIPDAVDILRGAKKTALNKAHYKNSYRELAFPGGDVPRTEGVCTDVVIRTLRNTGRDLQERLARDIEARPSAYPMVKKADPFIDHRRVRTLLPYFEKHAQKLPVDHTDSAFPYLPGDVVLMNTMGDRRPEHMGVVSDGLGESGFPLIINNWTDGHVTKEMDLLGSFEVTHRFRLVGPLEVEASHQGLSGVLERQGLTLEQSTQQALLVTVPGSNSSGGTLTRWTRSSTTWEQEGVEQAVRVGRKGLGTGLGLHESRTLVPAMKREGDKRAPAGVFLLGPAFGRPSAAPYRGSWPYRALTSMDHWIDDPESPDYNRWITLEPGEPLPRSSEKLNMYSLGLVVEHNTKRPQPGAGSAIFIHPWKTPNTATIGCTALPEEQLKDILSWLDPEKKPVLIQIAGRVF